VKVAVMMAAYNAERHIEATLNSLLRQRDAAQLDIIIVNDGSTDGTAAIIRRLSAEAPEIRLIETPNQGITRTRNVLLDAIAPGTDLITTMDSDDISPPGRFAGEIKVFESDPTIEMLYGYMLVFRGAGDDPLAPEFTGRTAQLRTIHLGAMLARPSLYERTGRFDERFVQAEDTDYIFRMIESGPKTHLWPGVSYYYRRHETNISSDRTIIRREFARAVAASAHRRRRGAYKAVPPDFFDHSLLTDGTDWF
jgi:glycosyltransferase involved in cell wall biosynthesis